MQKCLDPFEYLQEQKQTNPHYSRVHEAITKLKIEGYVELRSVGESKKHNKTTYYGLTFKGTLRYLSSFYNVEKALNPETEKKLLSFLKRQGDVFNYPLFQECNWLHERGIGVPCFVEGARRELLKPSAAAASTAELTEDFSKHLNDPDPDTNFTVDDIVDFRKIENLMIMYDFSERYLIENLYSRDIYQINTNKKLQVFARLILNHHLEGISELERAVNFFK